MHRENQGWRIDGWAEASEVLWLPACRMPADVTNLRLPKGQCRRQSHFTGVFQWTGGVVGEAESGLFDYSGRKSVEYFGVGN
ncbi:MAG: hypothetical protein DSM106950_23270 [Stigonema ocellatum SAG 48.90 = DSM 106950]|nr:hypothetical protein [Stigonema ocellatum SAG 48.90 = DSM 106950]